MNNNASRHLINIAVLITGLVSASFAQAGQVGSSVGTFEVTASGQSAYSMAIEVPPGIMGVVPQVAINYSSGGGNGLVGIGGSFSGFSSISRCGSSIVQDGIAKPVQLSPEDYFCLNGQRLILMSGTYGADGATYQTQVESFQRVTSHGAVAYPNGGTGPESFTVQSKGGSQLVFGATAAARAVDESTSVVAAWAISYLQDKHGNRVDYSYRHDLTTTDGNGVTTYEVLPHKINYGRNDSMSVAGDLEVEFIYEDRPDASYGYARGSKVKSTQRLKSILTKVGQDENGNDVIVKDYRVNYELSPVGGQSRIKSLVECAGNGNCLLPLTFSWHDYDNSWTQQSDSGPAALYTANGNARGVSVDINNDGWTDRIIAIKQADGTSTLTTWLNSEANGWQTSNDFTLPGVLLDYEIHANGVPVGQLIDINGDGLSDYVQAYTLDGTTTNIVYTNTGSGFTQDGSLPDVFFTVQTGQQPTARMRMSDLNGDALVDLILSVRNTDGSTEQQVWLGSQAGGSTSWVPSTDYLLPEVLLDYQNNALGTSRGDLMDINADGLVDLVQSTKDTQGITHNSVWLNTANGWEVATQWQLPIVAEQYTTAGKSINQLQMVDINADGLTDVVQSHQFDGGSHQRNVWLNTGLGWQQDNTLAPPATLAIYTNDEVETRGLFMDVNNDALPDLVESYQKTNGNIINKVWKNEGDSWVQDNTLALPTHLFVSQTNGSSKGYASFDDINNDGRGDIIVSSEGETDAAWLGGVSNSSFALPEVAIEFFDGLANGQKVEYSLGIFNDLYTPSTVINAYPVVNVAGPMLLIKAVDAADGSGSYARSENHYTGRRVHVTGRGDLGFASKTVTDTRTGIYLTTQFSQEWPVTGKPLHFEKRTAADTLLEESTTSYAQVSLFAGKTLRTWQDSKNLNSYDLDGSPIRAVQQTYQIDNYANVTQAQTIVSHAGESVTTTAVSTYENDAANWHLSKLLRTQRTVQVTGQTPVINIAEFQYDANANLLRKIIEPGNAQAVTEEYQKDGFGHRIQTTVSAAGVPALSTTGTYTADGRFAASATNQAGHSAFTEYHSHHGQVTKSIDANNLETRKLYDEYGRMIKQTQIRGVFDATESGDDSKNVVVFHSCADITPSEGEAHPCPDNAVYFLGVVTTEGIPPESVYYDQRHREVRRKRSGFDDRQTNPDTSEPIGDIDVVYQDTEYDSFGRKYKVSEKYFKDETPKWTEKEYDILGRVTRAIYPGGISNSKSYSGNTIIMTNALGQSQTTIMNVQGKAKQVTDANGNKIEYTYDSADRLLKTRDPHGNEIIISYDHFGRKTQQDDPDLGTWDYQYNALGQLIWQQDAKGQIVAMEYDVLGRVTKRTEVEGETLWVYDTAPNGLGKLASVTDPLGYTRSHEYDEFSRAIRTTINIDGETHVTDMAYLGTQDKVDFIQYPSGLMIRKTYDTGGYPLEIRSNGLLQYQDYLDKIAEAQDYAAQAVDMDNDTLVTRQDLEAEAIQEQNIGNNWAQQARNKQDEARPHITEYNQRAANIRHHIAKAKEIFKIIKNREAAANMYAAEAERMGADAARHAEAAAATKSSGKAKDAERVANLAQGHADTAQAYVDEINNVWMPKYNYENERTLANRNRALYLGDVISGIITHASQLSKQANNHFRIANQNVRQIKAINAEITALVDNAEKASENAELLLADYNEGSNLHWQAKVINAAGQVTEFKQGDYVTTEVGFDVNTGRLANVLATSSNTVEAQNEDDDYSGLKLEIDAWGTYLLSASTEAQSNQALAQVDYDALQLEYQQAVDNADFYRDQDEVAMALVEDSEVSRLQVELETQQLVVGLNVSLDTLAQQTAAQAAGLIESHNTDAEYRVTMLSFDYYSLKQNYHLGLETIYRNIASAQTEKSAQYQALALQTPDNIDTLNDLSNEKLAMADYHNDRQFLFMQQTYNGYANSDSGLLNQYTDESSINSLELLVSDTYQGRSDVYAGQANVISNIFSPAQRINGLLAELNEYRNDDNLAQRYQSQTTVGQQTIDAYRNLSELYNSRSISAQSQESIDTLLGERATADQRSFEAQASENQIRSELYTDMATPEFWETFYQELADQHIETGLLYTQIADEQKVIADDNAELVEDAQNEADHTLLGFDGLILNDSYTWDAAGNLTERVHGAVDVTQTFEYDELNRLTATNMTGDGIELYEMAGVTTTTINYDAVGNITYKSNVGTYTYGAQAGPHAVTSITGDVYAGQKSATYNYDANGNMTSGDGRTLQYTSHNKPTEITKGSKVTQFTYGPERQIVKQIDTTEEGISTTMNFGSYEKVTADGEVTHKYHIGGPTGGVIAVLIDKGTEVPKTHYLHRDHLNSIVAITDDRGFVVERFHYDAFGQRRTAVGVQSESFLNTLNLDITDSGFTGHKYLAGVDLIHMKGRVYDATIGRFITADPHIQFAGNTQSYNRYSYVLNNPLRYTDPSGYFINFIIMAVVNAILAIIAAVIAAVMAIIAAIAAVIAAVITAVASAMTAVAGAISGGFFGGLTAFWNAVWTGAVVGGVQGLVTTGSLTGALKGAAFGAITAGVGYGVGNLGIGGQAIEKGAGFAKNAGAFISNGINSALTNGVVGKLQGGSFSKSFVGSLKSYVKNAAQNFALGLAQKVALKVGGSMAVNLSNRVGGWVEGVFSGGDAEEGLLREVEEGHKRPTGSDEISRGSDCGTGYCTPEEAVDSIATNIDEKKTEWGGGVYQNDDGSYSATNPIDGGKKRSFETDLVKFPEGKEPVAFYHNHPGGTGPSYRIDNKTGILSADIGFAENESFDIFVITNKRKLFDKTDYYNIIRYDHMTNKTERILFGN